MISIDKRKFEKNEDCSLPSSSPSKYKIRKVSAVRDFPCSNGQHTALINLDTEEEVEEGDLEMPFDFSKDEGQKPDGFHGVEGKGFEFQSQDITAVCSEGNATPCLVKCDSREGNSEDLGGEFDESFCKNPKASQTLNGKMIEGSTLQSSLLPYHPIPSCLERKERKYPPRKSVSAVRDFPSGCRCISQQVIEADNGSLGGEDTDEQRTGVCFDAEAVSMNEVSMPSSQYNNVEHEMEMQNEEGRVIVLCLMPETNYPWKRGGEAVKPRLSSSNTKRNRGKKQDYVDLDKHKCSTNKSEATSVNLGESCTALVPEQSETDMSEFSSISRCEGDSIEDEELLVPRKRNFDLSLPPLGAASSGARIKVRDALRTFHSAIRNNQHEQTKSKKKGNANKRIDLRAAKVVKDSGKYVNVSKKGILGSVPGVEVGDLFHFRIELMIVGLHRHLQSGIDYLNQGKKIIATSIVDSGGYANGVDSSDVLIYTGQGGNASGDKEAEDQKLERGNLSLKNSIDEKNAVRVIRGFKERKLTDTDGGRHKTIATYTYDGLYTVEKYWHDIGQHGKLVYKFQLRRLPGQPELAWKEVRRSKYHKVREGLCTDDISNARESVPICAINTIDDENPPSFTYITNMMYPDWCQPIPPKGCDCKDGCSDSESCACSTKNGGEIPYNYDGEILEAKSLVYECGPSCKCPSTCHNRASQYGVKFPLEIFKTESRGWGVRCLSSIPSGSFICEYLGELLDDKDAEQRTGNDEYLFDVGQNYNNPTCDGLSGVMPDVPASSSDVENVRFTIDAAKYGNIGRFINHSCSPNLYAQDVLYDYDDKRIPHVMLFATENIPPLKELSYDYNYIIDEVKYPDGNIKKKSCYCGSSGCTGRMY